MVKESLPELKIINMPETCAAYVKESQPLIRRLGLLATMGTFKSKVYHEYFKEGEFELLEPEAQGQERIHDAVYSGEYGIKAHSRNIRTQARDMIHSEIRRLIDRGAQAVILGCTELPLAAQPEIYSIPVIDPGLLTARRLIHLAAPEKLAR
jgi:aspartate racemase